jgi:divalent metal cation (Fe/Co/Zn/Cd) transporter
VVLEDSAAPLGIFIGFCGVSAAHRFQNPNWDAGASIVIGPVLMAVAAILVYESRSLLVGEAADPTMLHDIRDLARRDAGVERVGRPYTMYVGPDTMLLILQVQFRSNLSAADVTVAVDRIERAIQARYPEIRQLFLEAEYLSAGAGSLANHLQRV